MEDDILRKQLVELLSGKGAHIPFEDAVAGFPFNKVGELVRPFPHSGWDLLFHIHIALVDIISFIKGIDYKPVDYPHGYWPENHNPLNKNEWDNTVNAVLDDIKELQNMVKDKNNNLFESFTHGSGQNLLREVLISSDHNSYHIAQLIDLRMALNCPVKDW